MIPRFQAVAVAIAAICLLSACSKPTDIVFGENPLQTITEHGEELRKLPQEDRELLARFIRAREMQTILPEAVSGDPADDGGLSGRTVGEVLTMAQTWQADVNARLAAAEALKLRALAERKAAMDRISQSVSVALLKKWVRPRDIDEGRYHAELRLLFAVENKSAQDVRLLKGRVLFVDAAGDQLGTVDVEFDETMAAGKVTQSDMGSYWRLTNGLGSELERIAGTSDGGLKATFEPTSLVFADGTVLKAPSD